MSDNYTSQINAAFEALKYNPHATQQLLQQQQHNPGGAQGPETLAAAAAANYQKSLQTPPPQQPPQQSVVAGLTQQPQMPMGLEAPYLEDFAQQQQQQRMATGGIVALAHGGPVQGYAEGGNTGRSAVTSADILRNTTFENIPHEGGASPIVDYSGRKIAVANIYGKKVPFYVSTGSGGKASVPAGKWYPYFGHDPETGWFNKSSEAEINRYYDSPVLEDIAKHLDNTVGDIRHVGGPSISKNSPAMNFINEGLNPTGRQGSHEAFRSNLQNTLDSLHDAVLNSPERSFAQNPTQEAYNARAPRDAQNMSPEAQDFLNRPTLANETSPATVTDPWSGEISKVASTPTPADGTGTLAKYAGKMGRALEAVGPYAWGLDPRVQASARLATGAAKGSAKDILEGLTQLNSSDSTLEGLDWLVQHGDLGKRLGFASGGEVRGFDDGGLLKSLTGQRQSPGMRVYEGIRNLFSSAREANPTVADDSSQSPIDAAGLSDALDTANQTPDFSYMERSPNSPLPKFDLASTGTTPILPTRRQTISTSEPQQPRPRQELEAPKKADGSPLSYEDQINYVQKVLGVPPDVSAEIKGQLEKRMAHEGNVNLIKDIAAGLGGFLGTRGYGQERVGAGIMNALQSSAIHGKEEGEMQDKIDALHLKSMMLPYESRHQAGTLVLQNQQKLHEAQAAAAAKRGEQVYERGTKFGTEQIQGEFGLQREGLQNKSQMEIAQMKADADLKLEAAKTAIANNSLTGTNKTAVYNHLSELAGLGLIDRAKLDEAFQQSIATITGRSAPQAAPSLLGQTSTGESLFMTGTPTTP